MENETLRNPDGSGMSDDITEAVQSAVEEVLGDALESVLGDKLGDAIEDALDDKLEDALESALEDAIEDAVGDAVASLGRRDTGGARLYILSQDGKYFGEFVCAQIWNSTISITTIPSTTRNFGTYETDEAAIAELGRIADALANAESGKITVYRMK